MDVHTDLTRRSALAGMALATGAGMAFFVGGSAAAQALTARPPADWRRTLADQYFATGAEFAVRGLQDGIELWETAGTGYMIVETSRKLFIEGSATARSPYAGAAGDLTYLGPSQYFSGNAGSSKNLWTGAPCKPAELRAVGVDASLTLRDTLAAPAVTEAATSNGATIAAANALEPVKAGEIKSRVPSFTLITLSTLYPNSTGICGWVAGSIVTRYWHARSSAKKLLPSKYRNGTNMTASPNFATYLQGSSGNSSWARDVKDRLIWNANLQGVAHSAAWALGNIGMFNDVRAGNPVIVFGQLPNANGNKVAHAVVAYGETTGGYLITHYGWAGYTNIVLNTGLAGSNTKFKLS